MLRLFTRSGSVFFDRTNQVMSKKAKRRARSRCLMWITFALVALAVDASRKRRLASSLNNRLLSIMDSRGAVLISVIITVCNEKQREIERAVYSITKQGFMHIMEINMIIDCNLIDAVDTFKLFRKQFTTAQQVEVDELDYTRSCHANRFNLLRLDNHCGLACARNIGVQMSCGMFVWPLHADDYIAKYTLRTMFHELIDNKIDFGDESMLNVIVPGLGVAERRLAKWQPTEITQNLKYMNTYHSCGMIRREVFQTVKYNEALVFGWEDWDLWLNLEYKLGIRGYIFEGPWYVYSSAAQRSHHLGSFCSRYSNICTSLLRVANFEKFNKTEVIDALRHLSNKKTLHILVGEKLSWQTFQRNAGRSSQLTNAAVFLPLKKLVSENSEEGWQVMCAEVMKKLMMYPNCGTEAVTAKTLDYFPMILRAHEVITEFANFVHSREQVLYHQIVSKCDSGEFKSLQAHSAVSVLKTVKNSLLIIHIGNHDVGCVAHLTSFLPKNRLRFSTIVWSKTAMNALQHAQALWRKLENSKYFYSHVTDLSRYAVLYELGGVYLDTDIILTREVPPEANLCLETTTVLNGAFMQFPRNSTFLRIVLNLFEQEYNGNCWGCVGPLLITKVTEYLKGTDLAPNILTSKAFYSTHWSEAHKLFDEVVDDNYMGDGVLGYHLWSKITVSMLSSATSDSIASRLFRFSCSSSIHQHCLSSQHS